MVFYGKACIACWQSHNKLIAVHSFLLWMGLHFLTSVQDSQVWNWTITWNCAWRYDDILAANLPRWNHWSGWTRIRRRLQSYSKLCHVLPLGLQKLNWRYRHSSLWTLDVTHRRKPQNCTRNDWHYLAVLVLESVLLPHHPAQLPDCHCEWIILRNCFWISHFHVRAQGLDEHWGKTAVQEVHEKQDR